MSKTPMSEKSDDMKSVIENLFPGTLECIEQGKCPLCYNTINIAEFVDLISLREYEISGMCQKCQTVAFAEPEPHPDNKWAHLGGEYYDSTDQEV